jgi:predicted dehydrogenase
MVSVALIGSGHWGPNLLRNFHQRPRSQVLWVVDRDAARLREVQARYPDVGISEHVDLVLSDRRIDAVVIATPTSTHCALATAALRAGKHVLVEKPVTTSARDAEALTALAESGQRVLMAGHTFVYNAAIQWIRRYLDSGELGPIYYLAMIRTNMGPIRMDVNAAWDLAAHDVSILDYWLQAEPESVTATGASWINPGIEDAVFATLAYPNRVLANLHVSWLNPRKAREITIAGDRRMLTFDDMNVSEPIRIYDKRVTDDLGRPGWVDSFASFRASIRDGDVTIPRVSSGEPLRFECDHFLDCIEQGKPPLTGGAAGMRVVRALEAIDRSVRNHGEMQHLGDAPHSTR